MTKEEFKEILKKYNEGKKTFAVGIDVKDLKKVDLEEYKRVIKEFAKLKDVQGDEWLVKTFAEYGSVHYLFDLIKERTLVVVILREKVSKVNHETINIDEWDNKSNYELWIKVIEEVHGILFDKSKEKTNEDKSNDLVLNVHNVRDLEIALKILDFRSNKKDILSNEIENLALLLWDKENLEVISTDGYVLFSSSQYLKKKNDNFKIIYAIQLKQLIEKLKSTKSKKVHISYYEDMQVDYFDVNDILNLDFEELYSFKRIEMERALRELRKLQAKHKKEKLYFRDVIFKINGDFKVGLDNSRNLLGAKNIELISKRSERDLSFHLDTIWKVIKNFRDREVIVMYNEKRHIVKFKSNLNDYAFYVVEAI